MEFYLVGGFIRNYLIKVPSHDVDFVFSGSMEEVQRFNDEIQGNVFRLSSEHSTFRVMLPSSYPIESLDFSSMQGKSITEDLGNRDFTVNAMALDLSNIIEQSGLAPFLKDFIANPTGFLDSLNNLQEELIDPYLGLTAIKRKSLETVSELAYKNDPLRIIRGIRLAAELGLTLTPANLNAMGLHAPLLRSIAGERIREEFFSILKSDSSYEWIQILDDVGVLKIIWPEIENLAQVKQNNHHEVDAWEHCKLALKALEVILNNEDFLSNDLRLEINNYLETKVTKNVTKKQLLKMATIFHDLGKLTTGQIRNEKITFYGHDKVGAELFSNIGRRIKLSTKELNFIKKLIYFHMRPLLLSLQKEVTDKSLYKLMVGLKEEILGLFIVALADHKSKYDIKGSEQETFQYGLFIHSLLIRIKKLQAKERQIALISGHDVLKVNPHISSRKIGYILETVRESQIVGKVKNKAEALELLEKLTKEV